MFQFKFFLCNVNLKHSEQFYTICDIFIVGLYVFIKLYQTNIIKYYNFYFQQTLSFISRDLNLLLTLSQ